MNLFGIKQEMLGCEQRKRK